MSLEKVRAIANAVLYEGCMLYPYRTSALKNQRPGWTFGALLPPSYSAQNPGESDEMRAEVLAIGAAEAELSAEIRFLQLAATGAGAEGVIERLISIRVRMAEIIEKPAAERFAYLAGDAGTLEGIVTIEAKHIAESCSRLTVQVRNCSALSEPAGVDRDRALRQAMLSANAALAVSEGEFISLLDPPAALSEEAGSCRQKGVFPVLAGDREQRSAMLVSPIILSDFPEVAPESPGDFFDSAEIDELLTLRLLSLSESERDEIGLANQIGRFLLIRTEGMSTDQIQKMHGAFRRTG